MGREVTTSTTWVCDRCGKRVEASQAYPTPEGPKPPQSWRLIYVGYGEPEDIRAPSHWLCGDCTDLHLKFLLGG